jgi:hypothetical protein
VGTAEGRFSGADDGGGSRVRSGRGNSMTGARRGHARVSPGAP